MGAANKLIVALETLSSKENAAPASVFKAFNDLIRANSQEVSENVSFVLEKFHPVTRIGRILKIRLVDRCRLHSEVLKLLQSGDSLEANQALKCRWFFTKLDNPENFVKQILPSLSHSVRLKVINKYSSYLENTTAGETLYLSLKSRYGIRDAVLVLPACRESFIRDEFSNLNGVILRPNLTLALHKKYPSLATEYLAYLIDAQSPHNRGGRNYYKLSDDYTPLFHKVSQTNLPAFMDIYGKHRKYVPYMVLGRRTMKMLIKRHFNQILTKYDACKDLFVRSSQFYKQLSCEEMKELFISCMLPPTITEFFELSRWDAPVRGLKNIKPDVRGVILQQGFQSKYGKDLFSSAYPPKFDDHWMELLPIESRAEKVEKRLTGVDNPREQAEFLAYLPVDQSIPRMKKLIEAQSGAEIRSDIAAHMVKSLRYNKNPKGLKDLFAYFNKRFRNEIKRFRERILSELDRDENFLLQLDKDDWAPIDELFDIIKLNKEVSDHSWSITRILKIQIHCYFLRSIEIEPHLEKYLEFQHANSDYLGGIDLTVCANTPFHRFCLEWFINKFPAIEWKSSSTKLLDIMRLLSLVNEVNKRNDLKQIVLPEEIIVEMEALMRDSELYDDGNFQRMLKEARHIPSLSDRLLKIAFPGCVKEAILIRLLKINPDLVRDELENVLAIVFNGNFHEYRSFYSKCRLYESYGIPQKLARTCRVSLKLEEDESVEGDSPLLEKLSQPHAVQVLSLVLQPSEYAALVSRYAPAQATIEDYSQEVVETFALQEAICRSFVAVSNPSAMLPLLRKFTVGDYLKIAVGSLSSVCSRVPEKEALSVLKEWTDCPVSLRKHVLRLMYRVAPAGESMEAFVEFFKKEKNSSLRRVIFLEIRRTFIADPNDQTLNIMSIIVNLLTSEDEVLKDLISVQPMSSLYFSRYLELIWSRIPDWESVLPNGKTNLIECIDIHTIESIDEKFSAELLSHDLNNLPGSLSKFVYLCILHAPSWDSQHARLMQVISALTPLVQNKWNERQTEPGHVFKVRRALSEFVNKLCEESQNCKDRQGAAKILNETKTALTGLSELQNSLELFYWLDAHILFLNVQNDPQTCFESALAGLYKTYIERYETLVPHSLAAILSNVVPMASSHTKLAHELVQASELPLCQILAAKITEKSIRTEKELPLFNLIIETLSSSKNPDVQNAASVLFEAIESSLII